VSSLTLTPAGDSRPRSVLAAAREQAHLVALLLVAAGVCWWWTAERMAGMYTGPSAELGSLGWFAGVWVVMMAAMMLPSLAPTAALYASRRDGRGVGRPVLGRPLLFVAGYLLAWGAAGVAAYGAIELGRHLFAGELAWSGGGRWLAGGVLVLAGAYELTPLKASWLSRCRSPLPDLRSVSREGSLGALAAGARVGAICLGCCAALMAALFALGVMSLTWMALVGALIAMQKLAPWRRTAVVATVVVLLALGVTLLAAPGDLPGLTVPGHCAMMHSMSMGAMGAGQS
jgi:predicted metal-binding membrane protein